MQKNAVASRLKRILSGNGTMTDILSIFFDVRSARTTVPAEVADLGDFAAHRAEKDRGPLLTSATALSKQVRMHLQGQSPLNAFPGYTAEHVSEALLSFCISSGAFQVSESVDLSPLVHLVALHGLVSMHGCRFKVLDGSKEAFLKARSSGGRLEIGCMVPSTVYGYAHPQADQIFFSLPAFCTSLPVTWARGRLLTDLVSNGSGSDAGTTIEVTDDLHLQYLE